MERLLCWQTRVLLLFCIFFSFSSLHAEEEFEVGKASVLDDRENFFLTSTDTRITPNVNPITGEVYEDCVDLVIAGSEPLSLRRFYNSHAPYDKRTASWRYNPECLFYANFELERQEIFASIGDRDGSMCSLKCRESDRACFDYEVPDSFLNLNPNGQSHPLNTHLSYTKIGDPKEAKRWRYTGTIIDGSGRERTFLSPMHRWLRTVRWTEKLPFKRRYYKISPNRWTPYHIPILEERLPNGNIIAYTYKEWREGKTSYPLPKLVGTITAYNADKSKVLASIELHYPRSESNQVGSIIAQGSDGRSSVAEHARAYPVTLLSSRAPGKASTQYEYEDRALTSISKPDGRVLKTEYDNEWRATAQYAPVGPNGEMHPIGRYRYEANKTIVSDAEGYETEYHFDDEKRITKIVSLLDGKPHKVERFECDPETGNLNRKVTEDGNETALLITEFTYDENQNPIEERVGDGREWRKIVRTFSKDGFNLLLTESDRDEKLICYRYIEGTNLLASKLIYEGDVIRKRLFNSYDDCAICIRTITDDGSSEDPDDLTNVTHRIIQEVTPKQTLPCFGLPEVKVEKTIDRSGREQLLSKIVYTYTPFGQVLQEDHYDGEGAYRCSVYNEYDEEERLISTINPLGAVTRFSYDANHNLTEVLGPRPEQACEVSYDQANRPISTKDRQLDGTFVTVRKEYNKLGQVTAEIDPSGHVTRFDYDLFGNVKSVTHPDGAREEKEYDLLGNLVKEIDANGYVTTHTYNAFQQVLSTVSSDGSTQEFSYNPTGTIRSHSENGCTTFYTYDIFDHPLETKTYSREGSLLKTKQSRWTAFRKIEEHEGDLTTLMTYDFAGRLICEQKAYSIHHHTYDALGKLASTANGDTTVFYTYDLCGRLIETRTESNHKIQRHEHYEYDESGNKISVITDSGVTKTRYTTDGKLHTVTDPFGFTTTYRYDYQNPCTETIIDPLGQQTLSVLDSRGREKYHLKKNAQGSLLQQSENVYDPNGNLITLIHTVFADKEPLKTLTHTWEYGPNNRLERFIEAGTKETRYFYNAIGHLQTILKPDGTPLSHEYDDFGRLSRYFSSDFDYTYEYDTLDRVLSVYDAVSNTFTTREYDPLGNLCFETLGNALSLSNRFDKQGRRIEQTLPDHSHIFLSYEGIDLQTVSRNLYTHTYQERTLQGYITKAALPFQYGSLKTKRDAVGRTIGFNAPHFQTKDFSYDPVGNLLSYSYEDALGKRDCSYSYDELYQLTDENEHTYAFDSLYNRLQKDQHDYHVNDLCQVTYDGQREYTYDACGNLTSDGSSRYTYDSLDRLIEVEQDDRRTTYSYDAFHRRLSKTTYDDQIPIEVTRYLWDGDDEIGSVNAQGELIELRVLGEGLGAEIGAAILLELHGKTYIPIHDHRGCLVTLIDTETKDPEVARYTSFGEELTSPTSSPWRFSSKRVDPETGFIFFGRRYYNANLGRWITQDPQGFEDGPNLYAYLHNSPLVDLDPYGLFSLRGFVDKIWTSFPPFQPPQYHRFEEKFSEKSSIGSLERPELPVGEIGRTNGIFTDEERARKAAFDLSEAIGGYNIHYTHNQTHGFYDLIEAGCNLYFGAATEPAYLTVERWEAYFAHAPPGVPYYEEAHSGGGGIVRCALELCSEEIRNRIIVRAFAPSAFIPKELCRDVVHYVSDRDIVPKFDVKGRKICADTIVVLPRHPDASKVFDHSIDSPTYQRTRREEVQKYLDLLKEYENN